MHACQSEHADVRADDLPLVLRYMCEETQGARVPEPTDDDWDSGDDGRPRVTRRWPVWGVDRACERRAPRRAHLGSRVQDLTREKGGPLAERIWGPGFSPANRCYTLPRPAEPWSALR